MGAPDWHRNGKLVEEQGHTTDLYTQEVLRLLESRDKDKPFYVHLSWNAPHAPLQAEENYLEQYAHINDEVRRTHAAMVTHIDDSVASGFAALEQKGLREDTLVIWMSDNGGTRVPALVNWPGRIEPGVLSQQMSALDWLSTLTSATGAGARRRPGGRPAGASRPGPGVSAQRSQQALFDVYADPTESSNLAAEHPELVRELAAVTRAIGADVPMMSRGFQLRGVGTFVRVGPLKAFP